MDPSKWAGFRFGGKEDKWPKDAQGEPVPPAFLQHITGSQLECEMAVNLLTAYDIPVFRTFPNDGEFGKLILGFAGTGMDIYVPETLLADAQNILCGDVQEDDTIGDVEELCP